MITEIGGTVGDIESLPFLEAIRQFRQDEGRDHVMFIHLTLVPYISAVGELKTKPTQHSVRELMEVGIQPDVVICRSEHPLSDGIKLKIARSSPTCPSRGSIEAPDADTIYAVPLDLRRQRLDDFVLSRLGLEAPAPDLSAWSKIVERIRKPTRGTVRIAVVGKYTELVDSYKSIQESLIHGGIENDVEVAIDWLSSEQFEEQGGAEGLPLETLDQYDGLLIPGGFGPRGSRGHARGDPVGPGAQDLPFFGICLGLQCAVIEFARNVCGLAPVRFVRVLEGVSRSGHLPDGLAAERHDQGRDHAPRRVARHASSRDRGSLPSTAPPRSGSGTGTATRSTTPTERRWKNTV